MTLSMMARGLKGRFVPAISIAANDNTVSVVQGSTVDIIYTLTRNGGYTGTVTPAVTGLPSGVSGAWSDSSLTSGETTTTLTLTASGGATVVSNDPFTVTFSGSGVSDAVDSAATVSVTASSGFAANLPAGLTLIGDTTFSATEITITPYGSDGIWWQNDTGNSGGRVISDPVGGADAATVFETYYPGNDAGNGVGGARIMNDGSENWTEFYFCIHVYIPTNYSIHTGGEKFYYGGKTNGSASPTGVLCNWEIDTGLGETANGSTFGIVSLPYLLFSEWRHQNVGTTRVTKGSWQTIEVYFKTNTGVGVANGVYKLWINGNLSANYSDLNFAQESGASGRPTLQGLRFDGTRGGGASSVNTPAGGQSRYYSRCAWYGA